METIISWILLSGIFISLLVIAAEDFKERAISLLYLSSFAIFAFAYGSYQNGIASLLVNFGWNLLFISSQLLFLTIYCSLKEKKIVNIADRYLGWGDILFFIPLCFLFTTIWLLPFYLFSLIAVLLVFLIVQLWKKDKNRTIPLAGGQAVCLMVWLIGSLYFDINYFENPLYPLTL